MPDKLPHQHLSPQPDSFPHLHPHKNNNKTTPPQNLQPGVPIGDDSAPESASTKPERTDIGATWSPPMKVPLVPNVETTAPLHPPVQQEPCDSFSVALRLPTSLVDCNEPLFVHTEQSHARGTDLELLQAFGDCRVDSRLVTFATFSVMQLSVSLRVGHCRALVPSCFIHLCALLREGNFVHLCTFSVCMCENAPSWHGQCLSCIVIASAAILQLC